LLVRKQEFQQQVATEEVEQTRAHTKNHRRKGTKNLGGHIAFRKT
jgi:hypothetical protein